MGQSGMGLPNSIRATISLPEASLNAAMTEERAEEILASYREAFHGFSPEELMILDGIMLEKPR
jgi:hypothetical protein